MSLISLRNGTLINRYIPKLSGALASIIVAYTIFPSWSPENHTDLFRLCVSVLFAMLGILLAVMKLELTVKVKVKLWDKRSKCAFEEFKKRLQEKYRTEEDKEAKIEGTEIIYIISAREKQFYYHLTGSILGDLITEQKLKAKEDIKVTVDYRKESK